MHYRKLLLVLGLILGIVCSQPALGKYELLQIYTALDPNEAKVYIEAFRRDTTINVQFQQMSAGDLITRLKAERKKPQASVWYGGPSIAFASAKKAGLLASYQSPNGGYLRGEQRDPAHYWSGYEFGAIAFACNIDFFKRTGLPYPTSWDDLLRPEFKKQIGIAYPYTSGTAYTVLATLVQLKGEEAAFQYWKKLDKNILKYNTSGSACVTQAGLGEVAVGISFTHDILAKGSAKGYPIKLSFPAEGTGYEIGAVALIKGAPEAKLGKRFIDWVLSKRAQEMLKIWYRIPLHPDAGVVKGAIRAREIKLIKNFDPVWAGDNQERLLKKWRQQLGK